MYVIHASPAEAARVQLVIGEIATRGEAYVSDITQATERAAALTVIVADRDRRVRAALRALLEADGTRRVVGEADDKDDLLQLAQDCAPDVVLVSLALPTVADGLSCLASLAQTGVTLVALSLGAAERQVALSHGAVAFLEKGVDADTLLATVDELAGRRSPLDR